MFKYITHQICSDDNKQTQIENEVHEKIKLRYKNNLAALKHYIPNVLPLVSHHTPSKYSIFCTKTSQVNMVDLTSGRAWYGSNPKEEIEEEVTSFIAAAPYRDFGFGKIDKWPVEAIGGSVEAIFMFGLGLGYQLHSLLNKIDLKYLVIYEPSLDVVHCSLQAADWKSFLETAERKGTQVFLQFSNDASSFPSDLLELTQVMCGSKVYLYRHYFHDVMDGVLAFSLSCPSLGDFVKNKGSEVASEQTEQCLPFHNSNVLGNFTYESFLNPNLFEANAAAFEEYYPEIYRAIADYKPLSWELIATEDKELNLWHKKRNAFFYGSFNAETEELFESCINHSLKNDIILGQEITKKLGHYLHFQAVSKIQDNIVKLMKGSSQDTLPKEVESIIIFGIGLGKHIERLYEIREIKNLYLCEPNLDFFYFSWHVVDWRSIIEKADDSGCRIYFNLGGDGSNYFNDLMLQFYQVGAYSIANTYMVSSYHDDRMQKNIQGLQSELRVVLAQGEYFDHARYGISHTYFNLKQKCKFLKSDFQKENRFLLLNKPLFVVGNGPSLDESIEYLRLYREQVTVISCGTALKSLHKNGIKPDFHAEIEQNRATYNWITQVNDYDYLNSIYLLSVNGIHPDTVQLFKDVVLCFKTGEPSTVLFEPMLASKGYSIIKLSNAFPTVTNLAVSFALEAGFQTIYLFGVDLGYADIRNHHSKFSAYYKDDGSEIYDYLEAHGDGIPAEGNFLPVVYTKPEFSLSRKRLEKVLSDKKAGIEVYNCSNGVMITGAVPLKPESILLDRANNLPGIELDNFIANAFFQDLSHLADELYTCFDFETFTTLITDWLELFERKLKSVDECQKFLESQWSFFRLSSQRNKLVFYLFSGTSNYFSSILAKVCSSCFGSDTEIVQTFLYIRDAWRDCIQNAHESFIREPLKLDDVNVSYLFKCDDL